MGRPDHWAGRQGDGRQGDGHQGDAARVDANRGRWSAETWLPAAGVYIRAGLIALPLLAIVIRAPLLWSDDALHLSAGNFWGLVTDLRFGFALFNTLVAGGFATAFSLALGGGLAFLVCRTDIPGSSLLEWLNLAPFFLSPYVGAISWIYLLAAHGGLIPTWLHTAYGVDPERFNIYGVSGVIFVLTLFHTPYVCLLMSPVLRGMDPAFEDAARAQGATLRYTLRHITLPLLLPALLSAARIVFISSAGMFDVPFALGAPRGVRFIPTEIYELTQYPPNLGRAAAFALMLLAVIVAVTFWQRRLLATRQWGSFTGTAHRRAPIRLPWPGKIAALALEAAYLVAGVLAPLAVLVIVSLTRGWSGRLVWRAFTVINYDHVLGSFDLTRDAIANSLFLALAAATIGLLLAMTRSYYLSHAARHWRRINEALSLSIAVPGIVVGLGWLILAKGTPLYGTLSIILIAYIARPSLVATRDINMTFGRVGPELEQIARSAGAGWGQTLRHIVVPLARPSLIGSWLLLFAIALRELGSTIMLYAQGTETVSVAMVTLNDRDAGAVAALAVLQMALLLVAFWLFQLSRMGRAA
jgi:iron(III) transport system permease protein